MEAPTLCEGLAGAHAPPMDAEDLERGKEDTKEAEAGEVSLAAGDEPIWVHWDSEEYVPPVELRASGVRQRPTRGSLLLHLQ